MALLDVFTIAVAWAHAPIILYSYAVVKGNYSDGTVIAGIPWDSHFTDLRVAVANPAGDDYSDLDLAIRPDKWTHRAALINAPSGCDLSQLGGNTLLSARPGQSVNSITISRLGHNFDAHDNAGSTYDTEATDGGYRLRCGKLPKHFTIQIVFASVDVPESLGPEPFVGPGTRTKVTELAGAKSEFDGLNPRPVPTKVTVQGSYTRIMKPYSVNVAVQVISD